MSGTPLAKAALTRAASKYPPAGGAAPAGAAVARTAGTRAAAPSAAERGAIRARAARMSLPSQRVGRHLGDLLVLLGAGGAGDADGAHDLPVHQDRHAPLQRQQLAVGDERGAASLDGILEHRG